MCMNFSALPPVGTDPGFPNPPGWFLVHNDLWMFPLSYLWTLFTFCYLVRESRFSFWMMWKCWPDMMGIYELWLPAPPPGPMKMVHCRGKERRAVSADRAEWTQLPGDRRYLCICQRFSVKVRRVTEVCVGVWKEREAKTQSIFCLPGVGSAGQTSFICLCMQLLHKDADGTFSQAPAFFFFSQGILPKTFAWKIKMFKVDKSCMC